MRPNVVNRAAGLEVRSAIASALTKVDTRRPYAWSGYPDKSAASRMAQSRDRCDHAGMPPTVLIVDDHPSFRLTARALLEAEDGETALEEAARLHPEVVLLDVQLPGIDGFEVAARLTSNGSSPAVVLTSSRDATEFSGLVERSGARGFVPKAELSAAGLTALLK